ncbi:hypothetical protein [Nostoc sp. UHCC 0251]|uniref:hypothetical protein n=1 Tax=Nostoc sp. UHCC 0251 TaxID=3110240 RepID=UPI002B20D961|nr:hypothetical protein [Nostoc sp. UHCC 0251]MEA5626464.1 hypothetical protein [Nostoc sp. UHCC 0251]
MEILTSETGVGNGDEGAGGAGGAGEAEEEGGAELLINYQCPMPHSPFPIPHSPFPSTYYGL